MSISSHEALVLRKSQRELKELRLVFWLIPIFIPFSFYLLFFNRTGDWSSFLQSIQKEPIAFLFIIGFFLLIIGLFAIVLIYPYQALKRERLILDAEGIHYHSHLPKYCQGFMPQFPKDWRITWSELSGLYLKPSPNPFVRGPRFIMLGIQAGVRYHEIFPCQWFDAKDNVDNPVKIQENSLTVEQIRMALQICPLIKHLTDKGLDITVDPKVSLKKSFFQSDFALESNPNGLAAAIFFFLLVGYAFFDYLVFNPETYIGQPFYNVYFWGGIGMGIIVMLWLVATKVPLKDSSMVALLVGGAFSAALYPGLLRINQWTDSIGLISYSYELQNDLSFKPLNDQNLPTLYLDKDRYWSDFATGSVYEFELRRGGLDFYQLHLAQVKQLMLELEKPEFVITPTPAAADYALPTQLLHTLKGHQKNVLPVAFSPDGHQIASGSKDKTVIIWDVQQGKRLHTLRGHQNKVQAVAFSPDGKLLASGSEDNTIKFWDSKTAQLIRTLEGHKKQFSSKVFSVVFSPDGKILASGNWDNSIVLWEVETGKVLHFIKERHNNSVNSVAFSPDGELLASSDFDNIINLWEVKTATHLKTLKGHSKAVLSVIFSPDGTQLASSSYDNTIKLWEFKSGKVLQTLLGHKDAVTSVAFHPNGKILVSGSFDRTLKLWEIKSGQLLSTLKSHQDYINTVVFSPNGDLIASASGDDTVKLWQ